MSANERYQVLLEINANVGKAVDALERVNGSMAKTEKSTSGLHGVLQRAAGFLVRDFARSMAGAISETVMLGGKIETLKTSFEALTKSSGKQVPTLEQLRTTTQGMISDVDLLTASNQALQLGLPTEDLDELILAGIKLGNAMGIDATAGVNSLITGVGRQSRLMLDNLGIIVDASQAYEWYAEKLGVSSSELDENQKRLGWQAYALEQIKKQSQLLGDNISDTAKQQSQWNASLENFKTVVGEALAPLSGLLTAMQPLMPLLGTLAANYLPDLIGKVPKLVKSIGNLDISAQSLAISVGAGVAAFGSVYSILVSLPPELRDTAATVAIVTGALVAATAAAVAFWTSISVGTLAPVIIAGVATAVAGVIVTLNEAKDSAADFTDELGNMADASETAAASLGGSLEASLQAVIDFWSSRINIEESALSKLITQYNNYYDTLEDRAAENRDRLVESANEGYSAQLDDLKVFLDNELALWGINLVDQRSVTEKYTDDILEVVTSHFDEVTDTLDRQLSVDTQKTKEAYSQQLSDTEEYYDSKIALIRQGLSEIEGQHSEELDALEAAFLTQKRTLQMKMEDQKITTDEYEWQINHITEGYNKDKQALNDDYRIKEIQYEQAHGDELEQLAADKEAKLKDVEKQRTEAVEQLERDHAAAVEDVATQKSQAIETVESTLKDRLIEIENTKNQSILAAEAQFNVEMKQLADQRAADIASIRTEAKNIVQGSLGEITAGEATEFGAYGEWRQYHGKEAFLERTFAEAHELFQAGNFEKYLNILLMLEDLRLITPEQATTAREAVPGAATGGIFGLNGPETITVGERGPEAVLPNNVLNKLRGQIVIHGPLLRVEGTVDATNRSWLLREMYKALESVVVEPSSSNAPATHKRIRRRNVF